MTMIPSKRCSATFSGARNLFEKSIERQALRVTELADPSPEELTTIRLKDLGVKLKDPNASSED